MAVTFNNAQFNGTQASQGAILAGLYAGTTLTGALDATAVTVNGTVSAPGNHVLVDLNIAGTVGVGFDGTYLGYSSLGGQHYEYYFSVTGVGIPTPVTIAVSGATLPLTQAALGVSSANPPTDVTLPSDSLSPVFQSASVTGNALTLTYNEILDAAHPPVPGNFAVTAGGAQSTVTGVAVSGNAVTLTLASAVAGGAPVTVAYTDPSTGNDTAAIQDRAGNDAVTFGARAVTNATPDTTAPLFQGASVNGNTLTLTYGEALDAAHPPAPGNFAVTAGGAQSTVTGVAVSGNAVTLTLAATVANGQAVTVAYTDPSLGNDTAAIQDLAGNDALTLGVTTATNATPDTTAPVFQGASVTGNTLTLTYGEALDATNRPTAASFAVTAGGAAATVSGVAVAGSTVTLTLAAPVASGQAVTVAYTDPSLANDTAAIQDLAGNDALTLGVTTVTNATPDTTAPLFQGASVNGNTLTLTYGEALDATNRPTAASFAVTAGGTVAAVNGVAVAGNSVVLTLATPVASGQPVTVAYVDPSLANDALAIQDVAGNDAATLGLTVVTNTTPDTTAPLFQSASVNGDTLTLTYGEALDATNRPTAASFAVTAGGAAATVNGVAVAGNTVVLTLAAPVASGQAVTVAYVDPSLANDALAIQDVAGNDAASLGAAVALNTTPDTVPPLFQSASVNGATLTLNYSEMLDAGAAPGPGAFVVSAGSVPVAVTAAAVSGSSVTLTLGTPVASGQAVTVAYADLTTGNDAVAVQDMAGNDAVSLAAVAVVNATPVAADTVPPAFQSAAVNGAVLTLTYGEAIDAATLPDAGAFTVAAGGAPVTVTGVAAVGSTVVLTLGAPVASGQAVTVAYADPTTGNDPRAVQDLAGNDAAGLTPTAVANTTPDLTAPVFQAAAANGATLTLTYGEALDAANPPTAGRFAVTADWAPVAVTGVAVTGNTVALTLGTPVGNGQAVTVAYLDPTLGDDAAAVQDLAGNDAVSLAATVALNTTPDTTPPAFRSASVDGTTLTLTYGESVDAAHLPASTAFTVTADGVARAVTGVAAAGSTVTLTLGTPVGSGQAVTVAYADPGIGNDALAVQDLAGNDAASLAATAVVNATPAPADTVPPAFQSAAVNGAVLTLTYGELLDAANPPAAGAFTVTAGGAPVAVSNVAVAGNSVALTLGAAVASGQAVTVAYADPGIGNDPAAIQDLAGNDALSLAATAALNTTTDATPPVFQTASVDGATLTLTYGEALDAANPPAAGAFTVTAGGAPVAVSAVAVAGNSVALTLGTAVASGQAVTVSYADPGAGDDTLAIQDRAGNDAASLAATAVVNATAVPVDTVAPVFLSGSVDAATVTLAYGEALDAGNPPPAGAFTVTAGGAPVGVTGAAVSGNSVVLTLGAPVASGQPVTVSYADPGVGNDTLAIQDVAGNDAAGLGATAIVNVTPAPVDATPPVLQSAAVDGATLVLAYGEALDAANPPAAGAFTVLADGNAVGVTGVAVAGNTVALTLGTAVASGQAVTVSYVDDPAVNDALAIQDVAGNDAADFAAQSVLNGTPAAVDTVPPVLVSGAVDAGTLTLTYSEALDAIHPPGGTDFTVTAGGTVVAVSSVAVSGNSVALTLAAPVASGQAVTVAYADPGTGDDLLAIQDVAGNDAAGFSATAVVNATPTPRDTTPPTFRSGAVSGAAVTLTFSEALDGTAPLDAAAFTVTAGGTVVAVSGAAASGNTVALTLAAPVASGQAVTVAYVDPAGGNAAPAVQDLAGNDAADFAATLVNATPDTSAPVFQAAAVDGRTLTLTYGEALDAANPPATGAFTVLADGIAVGVSNVAVAGNSVTLTLGTAVGNGQGVTVSYADNPGINEALAIQDGAGNDAAALVAAPVLNTTPDTTPPVFQSATVNGAALTLTYGEALDTANPPDRTAFTVTSGGAPVTVSGLTVVGNTVALTLATAVASGAAVTVSYADNPGINEALAIQDAVGNDAAGLAAAPVLNATPDTSPPVFQSGSVYGGTVTLTYGEVLDARNPPVAGAFTVLADGNAVAVSGVAVSGNTVALTLGTAVGNGQAVTVSYADPTPGANDALAIQDVAGNDAASLVAVPLVNATPDTTPPVFQSGSVDGGTVTLTYGETLDAANLPAAGAFTVLADGNAVAVSNVAATGNTVTLTLGAPVASGAAVTVAYADPTPGVNDPSAIQDLAGNDAAGLAATAIVNATADTTPPLFRTGSANAGTVTLTYGEALDAANPPDGSAFTVTADGARVAVSNVAVTGNVVALTLAAPVASGAAVLVSYRDPSGANDPAAVQDLAGNDAVDLGPVAVANATPAPLDTTAPAFQSGSVSAGTVTLTYGETLDAANPPAADAFTVLADGTPVGVSSVAVTGNIVALTLATPVANGQSVTVAYADPTPGNSPAAVQDLAGNDAVDLAATAIVNATPDTTLPVFRTGSVEGGTVTLTYSEALDAANPPAGSAFTVTVDGVATSVGTVAISGNSVSLALATPVANGQVVTVAYADPTGGDDPQAVQDLAGNDALGFGATAVVNATRDTTSPIFQSGSVDGAALTLNYSEALDAGNPPAASAFTVTAGGAPVAVTGAAVVGNTVALTLGTAVTSGQAVTVTYADNPAVDEPLAIQDIAGNDAAGLVGATVVNATPDTAAPVFQTASVAGTTLTLTYGEALDAAHPPAAGTFAVTAGGASVAVTGATVTGNSVALTLGTPVTSGQVVTVAYGDPSGANDTFAIQDVAGNDAASLGATVAVNTTASTADTRAPVFQAAAVDGATLTLTYDETLDAAHAPVAGDFTVAAGGAPGTVSSVSVSGRVVTLTLATPVASGQAVTVAYADPSGANDVFAIQDPAGNDAASLVPTPVGNTTPAGGGGTGGGGTGGGGGTVDPTQGTPGTGGTGTGGTGTGTTGTGTGGSGTGTSGGTQSNVPPDAGSPSAGGQPGPAQQPTIGTVTGANPPADPAGTGLQTPATVDGTPVDSATPTVSGTATPGSTVTLYDTDGTTVLGTGAADAGTGAYAITSTPLGEGTHVLTTTETVGGGEGIHSAPLTIDVDTQGPAIAFDPAVTVLGPFRAILSGTVADPSGIVSVDVRTAGRDVGSAAVSADGTWSIAVRAGRSFVTGIEATAVDAAGNQATAPSSYDLTFAIKGQPYRVTQDSYDPQSGSYTGSTYFKRDGGELYHSTFAPRPNGAGAYTYTGGSFFDDKTYGSFTDVYDADGTVKFQSQHNEDGTVATAGQKDGITVPNIPNNTITANGADDRFVFTPRAGQSVITDFQASGEGHDVIAFVGTELSSLADVLRNTTMRGDDAVIHITPTASVELAGVSKEQISQAPSAFKFHD